MKIPVLFALTGLLVAKAVAGTAVVIYPDADTTISSFFTETNYGGYATILAGRNSTSDHRILLRFDVGAAIPAGAVIRSASLKITRADDSETEPLARGGSLFLHRVGAFWNEGRGEPGVEPLVGDNEVTWMRRVHPAVQWATPGGGKGADFVKKPRSIARPGGYPVWTFPSTPRVVADVQTWLDRPDKNEGWVIVEKALREDLPMSFNSREAEEGRPQLDVVYDTPVRGDGAETAEYEGSFTALWYKETHPADFPAGAHWSGIVGGVHNGNVSFWKRDVTASAGIQSMAEVGGKATLLGEVDTAIGNQTALAQLSGPGIGREAGRAAVRFTASRTHPMVTLTSMVAPSPDWFVGVRNLPLLERGRWVVEKSVILYPYDAGTDSGATFSAPNLVTDPRSVITRIITPPLANQKGFVRPMGIMTFRRIPAK